MEGDKNVEASAVRMERWLARPVYAKQITDRRERMGLTQGQLGAKVGVTRNTINRWETGDNPPPPPRRALLAQALDVSATTLAGWFK